jgi:beta-phosphoglucomutase
MEDNFKAWKYAFSKYGISIIKDQYYLLEGMPIVDVAQYFLKKNGIYNINPKDVAKLKDKYYLNNNSAKLYKNVLLILNKLSKRFKLALVTGASRNRLNKTLDKNILLSFDAVVTGNDVTKGKPHPQPYLMAANKLKVKPKECIAVENAPLGIKSSIKAGMFCIAITTTLDKMYLKNADKIIHKITDLSKIIGITK